MPILLTIPNESLNANPYARENFELEVGKPIPVDLSEHETVYLRFTGDEIAWIDAIFKIHGKKNPGILSDPGTLCVDYEPGVTSQVQLDLGLGLPTEERP